MRSRSEQGPTEADRVPTIALDKLAGVWGGSGGTSVSDFMNDTGFWADAPAASSGSGTAQAPAGFDQIADGTALLKTANGPRLGAARPLPPELQAMMQQANPSQTANMDLYMLGVPKSA